MDSSDGSESISEQLVSEQLEGNLFREAHRHEVFTYLQNADNLRMVVRILSTVQPGESVGEWTARAQLYITRLVRYIGGSEQDVSIALSRFDPHDERTLVNCDFCDAQLPWGYPSWNCTRCPLRYDVCQRCRANGRSQPGLCFVHGDVDPTDNVGVYMAESRLWRVVSLIFESISVPAY